MISENIYNRVTILIVTFKSQHIIDKCLSNINKNFNILVIENSADYDFTKNLKKKYKNLKTINIGYDSGYGFALNRGIENVETEYLISINPDSFPEQDCLIKLIKTANINSDVSMVVPLKLLKNKTKEFSAYGYFNKKKKFIKNDKNHLYVDWVNGNVFLARKKLFNEIGLFDENIFLEFEERDFQKRMHNNKKKIIIDFNAKSYHLEGKSADEKFSFQMKCEASWHHTWSKYYYYKKHYGNFYSLTKNLPTALMNILKFLIFKLTRNKRKAIIYKLLFKGFYSSLLNKKSFYRAEID